MLASQLKVPRPALLKQRSSLQPVRLVPRLRTADKTSAGHPTSGAAAAAATSAAFEVWQTTLPQWSSSTLNKKSANASDRSALAAAVSTAAKKYVPKRSLKVPHLDDLSEVPRDLHKRLELVGKVVLMEYLEDPELTVANFEHTTTDIAAALCGTGVVVEAKGKKTAYMSIVVTETERQMTWSRLEGLRFHWAVSSAPPPNQKWELPPRGWVTVPDTTVDAGGAWQSTFEKHPLPQPGGATAPDVMYTLILSVPLEGNMSKGGVIFVLKSGNTGQNTKWLKDAASKADFFVDVNEFPVKKA